MRSEYMIEILRLDEARRDRMALPVSRSLVDWLDDNVGVPVNEMAVTRRAAMPGSGRTIRLSDILMENREDHGEY